MLFLLLLVILLAFFSGARDSITASDYINYINIYNSVPVLSGVFSLDAFFTARTEPFYYLLNSIVKTIFNAYEPVFIVVSLLAVSLNLIAFRRLAPYFVVAVLLYFSHSYLYREFMQIRAGVACALLLMCIPALSEKRKVYFFLVVLLASGFHSAALLYFPMYWVYRKGISSSAYTVCILTALFFAILFDVKNILSLINDVGLLPRPLALYLFWDKYNYSLGILNPVTIKQIITVLFLIRYRNILTARVPYFDVMLFLYVFSTFWLIAFNDFAIIAGRVATFFSIVEPILLPSTILVFRQKKIPYCILFIFSFLMLFMNLEVKQVINEYGSFFWSRV